MAKTVEEYVEGGIRPIHHSEKYRNAHKPAYRLVDRKHLRLIPILVAASKLGGGTIVIDGPCASGKSTMAMQLAEILGASVIRVDDFFLPPKLRTEERLAEAGGNVHYERFKEEVIQQLKTGKEFSYTRFDCSVMDFGNEVKVPATKWRIVEGSYSHHPYFGQYGDIRVFSVVDADEQMSRIMVRNGAEMAARFEKTWIPMENRYFRVYNICEHATLRV
jgi:uridine kinase